MGYVSAGLGALVLIVAGLWQWERGDRIEAEAGQAALTKVAASQAVAITDLRADRDRTVTALEGAARASAAASTALQSVRSAAYAAPPSSACVVHPAARALRVSLRGGAAAGGGGGAAAGAGQPDRPMPATANAR